MNPSDEAKDGAKSSSESSSSSATTVLGAFGASNDAAAGAGGGPGAKSDGRATTGKENSATGGEEGPFGAEPWGEEGAASGSKRPRLGGGGAGAPPGETGPLAAAAGGPDQWALAAAAMREALRGDQSRACRVAGATLDRGRGTPGGGAGLAAAPHAEGGGEGSGGEAWGEGPGSAGAGRQKRPRSHWTMAQLAQEKTEQVLQLERQLSQSQSQLTALDAANSALREENRQLQARLDKTAHALRIAGQNATKAREDAAQAETTAAALSDQLQALQAAAGETKQTIEALTKEHRDISEDVRKVEARLVRALAKDAATTARHRELEARRAALEAQAEESRRDAAAWRGRHERSLETIRDLERGLDRAAEHSSARRAHSEQLAADHQNAVALLEASTRANRESDEALRQLREANGNLKKELASQASVLSEHRTTAQREKDRLNESFTKALAKAQHLELQLETLKAGAAAKEQEWQRERRTLMSMVASHDGSAGGGGGGSDDSGHGHGGAASATATPATRAADHPTPTFTGSGAEAASTAASWAPASAYASRIPPLSAFFGGGDRSRSKLPSLGSSKTPPPSSSSSAAAAGCCVVCLKPANTGLVVTCQCGRCCGKRGHAGCVSATTVIASTPLILCDSDGTGDSSSLGVGGGSRRGSAESGPWGPGV